MRTVLITGSSRGIGLAIAEAFCRSGDNIIMNCRKDIDEMNAQAMRLREINRSVIAVPADVSDYTEAKMLFETAGKEFGMPDILINNAGVAHYGLFTDMNPEEIAKIMNTNAGSVFNCTGLAVPSMVRKKSGVIINISSVWGIKGASCEAVYSASKGAVNAFTKAIAKELAPSGIRVNAIACGVTDTCMNDNLSEDEKLAIAEQIPVGRFAKPAEIAELAVFLASDGARYITGQISTIDGGYI